MKSLFALFFSARAARPVFAEDGNPERAMRIAELKWLLAEIASLLRTTQHGKPDPSDAVWRRRPSRRHVLAPHSLSVTMNQSAHPFTRALFGFLASVSLTTTIMVVLAA